MRKQYSFTLFLNFYEWDPVVLFCGFNSKVVSVGNFPCCLVFHCMTVTVYPFHC